MPDARPVPTGGGAAADRMMVIAAQAAVVGAIEQSPVTDAPAPIFVSESRVCWVTAPTACVVRFVYPVPTVHDPAAMFPLTENPAITPSPDAAAVAGDPALGAFDDPVLDAICPAAGAPVATPVHSWNSHTRLLSPEALQLIVMEVPDARPDGASATKNTKVAFALCAGVATRVQVRPPPDTLLGDALPDWFATARTTLFPAEIVPEVVAVVVAPARASVPVPLTATSDAAITRSSPETGAHARYASRTSRGLR